MSDDSRCAAVVHVRFEGRLRQPRLTVVLRVLLIIPNAIALDIVLVLAALVTVFDWFAAIAIGRLPRWSAAYLTWVLRWRLRYLAYYSFLTDRYPPFTGAPRPEDEVTLEVNPGPLRRSAVVFRAPLAFPTLLWAGALGLGMSVFSVLTWLLALLLGRVPASLYWANAITVRYLCRQSAYASMLTSEWPFGSFGDRRNPVATDRPSDAPIRPPNGESDATGRDAVTAPTGADQPSDLALDARARESATADVASIGAEDRARPSAVLVASRRTKMLVVAFLLVGACAGAVIVVLDVNRASSAAVLTQVDGDIAQQNRQITTTNAEVAKCPPAGRLSCLEKLLGEQSASYDELSTTLGRVGYPGSVTAQASAMEKDAARAGALYEEIATEPSLAALTARAKALSGDVTKALADFDTEYASMRKVLAPSI